MGFAFVLCGNREGFVRLFERRSFFLQRYFIQGFAGTGIKEKDMP